MYEIERDTKAIKCECGGYAERVDCTEEELEEYGCGRERLGFECCARAFVCCLCNKRTAMSAPAPEMR